MRTRRLLRRKAASQYLHETHGLERAPSTLAKLAVIGGGPIFRRINRVPLYSTDDLDGWVASKLSAPMRSTSDNVSSKTESADCSAQPDLGGEQQVGDNGAGKKSNAVERRGVTWAYRLIVSIYRRGNGSERRCYRAGNNTRRQGQQRR